MTVVRTEATQKILDGLSNLAAWMLDEARQLVVGLPRVEAALQRLKAHLETRSLCSACGEAKDASQHRQRERRAPADYPDQTGIHLGPHTVDRHPFEARIHRDPKVSRNQAHLHGADRHH